MGRYGRDTGAALAMGVGGSVDVIAGVTRRAPKTLQRLGLEWAYRMMQEPGRLWRRYAKTNLQFAAMLVGALVVRNQPGPTRAPGRLARLAFRGQPRNAARAGADHLIHIEVPVSSQPADERHVR